MSVYEEIRRAVIARKIVVLDYDGLERIMCPHVLGVSAAGRPQALCYQFGGQSRSRPLAPDGSPANWRCIDLAKVGGVSVRDGEWHTAPLTRAQTCVVQVDVAVEL